jgi:hypothetical protein
MIKISKITIIKEEFNKYREKDRVINKIYRVYYIGGPPSIYLLKYLQ